jgi:glutathione synthase/RimK-type ligase-like ATP-grasp enzyme
MLVGILYEPYKKFEENLRIYEKILDHNNIRHVRLDLNDPAFWDIIPRLDLFIFRGRIRDDQQQIIDTILPVIQNEYHIKCFPNLRTYWCYDDKIKEYLLLKSNGIPVIDSWIFWDKKEALRWFPEVELPVVFKLKSGASSSNVILVGNRSQGIRLIRKMFNKGIIPEKIPGNNSTQLKDFRLTKFIRKNSGKIYRLIKGEDPTPFWNRHKNYVFFQKFLPGNQYDTRVLVVNEKAFAFHRYNRKNDFRSSGSRIFDYDPDNIDKNIVKTAFEISAKLQFQSMAYDFLYDENKDIRVCEISYISPEKTVPTLPGYWDKDMKWHNRKMIVQYLHLVEALGMPELKMPSIKTLVPENG